MDYQGEYAKRQNNYAKYAAIKCLVDEYFKPVENKKYEEFIRKLVMILEL